MSNLRYKVLTSDNRGPYQNEFQYELGKTYTCDDFDLNKTHDCSRGFYATPTIEGALYVNLSNNKRVYECEVGGKSVEIDQFKCRYERIKLIRQLDEKEIRTLAKKLEPKLGYKLEEALYPVHPFKITPPTKITETHIEQLKQWNSVRDSVWNSVWDSVWDSVWNSVQASAWDSVWNSVQDSAWASVRASVQASAWASVQAYISSLFPGIKKWKYIKHKPGQNPFQPAIDLWHQGLVPSFDGKVWRLHGGIKGEVVWSQDQKNVQY